MPLKDIKIPRITIRVDIVNSGILTAAKPGTIAVSPV
jgi:hypothetical protein